MIRRILVPKRSFVGFRCLFDEAEPLEVSKDKKDFNVLNDLEDTKEEVMTHEEWIKKQTALLKKIDGPAWLGKGCVNIRLLKVFPSNPSYTPQKQWNDSSKTLVYKLYLTDPKVWTPRKISIKTKISVERVKAIIAMKQLEDKMIEQKFKPNTEYVKFMEKILQSSDVVLKDAISRVVQKSSGMAPKFVSVPEGVELKNEDIEKILNRNIRKEWVDKTVDKPLLPEEEVPGKVIQKDPYETNRRFAWIFTDVSRKPINPENRQILVREQDGTLRHASRLERLSEANKVWSRNARKMIK